MNEFHRFFLGHTLTSLQAAQKLRDVFPDFVWRKGDSDMQGPYVSGRSDDGIRMKLWLGEDPPILTVSFDSFEPEAVDRDQRAAKRLEEIKDLFSAHVAPISDLDQHVLSTAAE